MDALMRLSILLAYGGQYTIINDTIYVCVSNGVLIKKVGVDAVIFRSNTWYDAEYPGRKYYSLQDTIQRQQYKWKLYYGQDYFAELVHAANLHNILYPDRKHNERIGAYLHRVMLDTVSPIPIVSDKLIMTGGISDAELKWWGKDKKSKL